MSPDIYTTYEDSNCVVWELAWGVEHFEGDNYDGFWFDKGYEVNLITATPVTVTAYDEKLELHSVPMDYGSFVEYMGWNEDDFDIEVLEQEAAEAFDDEA